MFALFIPSPSGRSLPSTHETLASVGAAWALDISVTAMFADVLQDGPTGGAGKLVYFDGPGQRAPLTAVDLTTQRWQASSPIVGEQPDGAYWLGVWNAHKPTPDDLVRSTMVDGVEVALTDGRKWVVPVAEFLPKRLSIDHSTGRQVKVPFPQFAKFVSATHEMLELFLSDEFQERVASSFTVEIPGGLAFAGEALAINYRVNLDLLDMLELIGEFEAFEVAKVATGLNLIEDRLRDRQHAEST